MRYVLILLWAVALTAQAQTDDDEMLKDLDFFYHLDVLENEQVWDSEVPETDEKKGGKANDAKADN